MWIFTVARYNTEGGKERDAGKMLTAEHLGVMQRLTQLSPSKLNLQENNFWLVGPS